MKKILLIPTMLFPYTVSLFLLHNFIFSWAETKTYNFLSNLCVGCLVAALICNIIFIIISFSSKNKDKFLFDSLIVKLIHIPPYIFIFILGAFMGMMFFMTFPFILGLVVIDVLTMVLSSMISIFALLRNVKNHKLLYFLSIALQFFFVLDVVSLALVSYTVFKEKKNIITNS